MKNRFRYLILILLMLGGVQGFSRSNKVDSLVQRLEVEKVDSVRAGLCLQIGLLTYLSDSEKGERYALECIRISQKEGLEIKEASALSMLGVIYFYRNQYFKAIDLYNRSAVIQRKRKDKRKLSNLLRNIAMSYNEIGDYKKSVDHFYEALRIVEDQKDSANILATYNHLGNVYFRQKDFANALLYYQRAYSMGKLLDLKHDMSIALNNLGAVNTETGKLNLALEYYIPSLEIRKKLNDSLGMVSSYSNISLSYSKMGKHDLAVANGVIALNIAIAIDDDHSLYAAYSNLTTVYMNRDDMVKAKVYGLKALAYAEKMNTAEELAEIYSTLSDLYKSNNDHANALAYYKKHIILRDSLMNEAVTKKTTQSQMQYEFAKQQTADSIKNAERTKQEELKHDQEIKQQKIYTYGGAVGFLLMIVVAGVSYRAFKQKQRTNVLITEQKLLVEEKQKEVLDSIRYAKRIQQSLLPTEKYIDKNLKHLNKK